MDHSDIDRRHIVERYVVGKLPSPEVERFEEHYLDCAACCEAIEEAERLHRGLEQVAAEETERTLVQEAVAAGLLARLRRTPGVVRAALTLVLALVPAALLWRQSGQLRQDLGEVRGELTRERDARQQLSQALEDERQPRWGVPILSLSPFRGSGDAPVQQISLAPEPEWVLLSIELDDAGGRYRATLARAGDVVWQAPNLEPSYRGTLTVSFHSSSLPPGDYELSLVALESDPAAESPAESRFPLRVTRQR